MCECVAVWAVCVECVFGDGGRGWGEFSPFKHHSNVCSVRQAAGNDSSSSRSGWFVTAGVMLRTCSGRT
jgi:hypothetical protein